MAHSLPEGATAGEAHEAERWALYLPVGDAFVFRHSHLRLGREEAFWRSCRLLAKQKDWVSAKQREGSCEEERVREGE